jgi:hypothetical protein
MQITPGLKNGKTNNKKTKDMQQFCVNIRTLDA